VECTYRKSDKHAIYYMINYTFIVTYYFYIYLIVHFTCTK